MWYVGWGVHGNLCLGGIWDPDLEGTGDGTDMSDPTGRNSVLDGTEARVVIWSNGVVVWGRRNLSKYARSMRWGGFLEWFMMWVMMAEGRRSIASEIGFGDRWSSYPSYGECVGMGDEFRSVWGMVMGSGGRGYERSEVEEVYVLPDGDGVRLVMEEETVVMRLEDWRAFGLGLGNVLALRKRVWGSRVGTVDPVVDVWDRFKEVWVQGVALGRMWRYVDPTGVRRMMRMLDVGSFAFRMGKFSRMIEDR